ncbi:hypothetical protein [Streptomyces sp. NPDC050145]|uniref:hypothetical protein n=1 Tax=Streptomyces sp. NPDC050145 TaxID=3365602 RepID=UPI0037A5BBE1
MTGLVALVAAAGVFAAGYAAAHVRPLHRADNWAWEQLYQRAEDLRVGPAPRRLGWYAAQVVFAVEIAAIFTVHPRRTAHRWRHRNDPPPTRSTAVRITPTRPADTEQEHPA